jgi:S1-C subfamily serine protease
MRNAFFLFIILSMLSTACHKKSKPVVSGDIPTDIKKWEKSVVNIECQSLRYSPEEINEIIEIERSRNKFNTEQDEIERRAELGRETNPVAGTAIYFTDKGKKYLVTAKHVIFDPQESSGNSGQRLYKDISIRTPYDYYLKSKINNSSIPSTGYGFANPFYLSDDATDIGIISLQASLTNSLIKTLEDDGYIPIDISDIDTSHTNNAGESIAAIGYPDISKIGVFQKINDYQSNVVVLPVSTFGSIAMFHHRLSYFISDITVYPGNSGGPIIKANKLIGIVSGQVLIPADKRDANNDYYSTSLFSRGTLTKVIKAEYVIRGLQKLQQIELDKSFR